MNFWAAPKFLRKGGTLGPNALDVLIAIGVKCWFIARLTDFSLFLPSNWSSSVPASLTHCQQQIIGQRCPGMRHPAQGLSRTSMASLGHHQASSHLLSKYHMILSL